MVKGDVFMKIAISGDLGSGISSVAKCLSEKLNFKYLSMGDIFRDFANKKGLTVLELNEKAKIDKTIDEGIDLSLRRKANLSENMVIDSRLAWYFVKNAFKVYISVDEVVAAKRIMNSNLGNMARKRLDLRNTDMSVLLQTFFDVKTQMIGGTTSACYSIWNRM